jgi:hypothetical protein
VRTPQKYVVYLTLAKSGIRGTIQRTKFIIHFPDYSTRINPIKIGTQFVISGPIRTKLPDYSSHVRIIGY